MTDIPDWEGLGRQWLEQSDLGRAYTGASEAFDQATSTVKETTDQLLDLAEQLEPRHAVMLLQLIRNPESFLWSLGNKMTSRDKTALLQGLGLLKAETRGATSALRTSNKMPYARRRYTAARKFTRGRYNVGYRKSYNVRRRPVYRKQTRTTPGKRTLSLVLKALRAK